MKTVYRIVRLRDGLFSRGGGTPGFRKSGKTWSTRSALSNHFACVRYYDPNLKVYEGCEILEIEVSEANTKKYPVSSWTLKK